MKPKHRNIFLAIGLIAVVLMLCTLDTTWAEVLACVKRAGLWLPIAILLWVPIYMMNAQAWRIILNDKGESRVGYWRMLKYTITGYALNYVTPVGLLGGEPYRIMELTSYVGPTRATSSVILYSMTHILSHFCFWAFSTVLFLALHYNALNPLTATLLAIIATFCILGIYLFLKGYRNGFARRTLHLLSHLPLAGKRIKQFALNHAEGISNIDAQISALHSQRRRTFRLSLALEFLARILGCLEVMFFLLVFTRNVSFCDSILIQAFSTLFANLLFFVPMQMGTREGGLALIAEGLSFKGSYGVLTGLLTRLRELFWIAVGLLLIRAGNRKSP